MLLFSLLPLFLTLLTTVGAAPSISSDVDEGDWIQYSKRAQSVPNFGNRAYKTVRGVNLGGWFILESWMTPSFFTPDLVAKGAIDQWTFMLAVNDNAKALALLQNHWATFITESDFQAIAAAGLNTVRIPVGHWTFAPVASEPYLANAEFTYIAAAVKWAAKYKLDVVLDLHTAPNSQNGFDNSGHQGPINFQAVNATANAATVYAALQSIVSHFVNHKLYGGAVKAIEILNEPACWVINQSYMTSVHQAAYAAIRNTVSTTALVKPTVVIHDCFVQPLSNWYSTYANTKTWVKGSYAIDTHRYTAFAPTSTQLAGNLPAHINYICNLQSEMVGAYAKFPLVVGEWSLGVACSNCTYNTMLESVASQNTQERNLFYRQFYEAQVTTYEMAGGWIFWNWKTESNAAWSYQAGLAQGWIPQNPTTRVFAQTNRCPTSTLIKNVTFATTSMSTTTTNTSLIAVSKKYTSAKVLSVLDTIPAVNTTANSTTPVVVYNNTGTVSGVLQDIIPQIVSIPQTVIDSNAHPFVAKSTFGQGLWH